MPDAMTLLVVVALVVVAALCAGRARPPGLAGGRARRRGAGGGRHPHAARSAEGGQRRISSATCGRISRTRAASRRPPRRRRAPSSARRSAQHAQAMQQQLGGDGRRAERAAEALRRPARRAHARRTSSGSKRCARPSSSASTCCAARMRRSSTRCARPSTRSCRPRSTQRLGQSFKQVSDRLEQVHKGLGEMQTLAAGVGDLKRVLTQRQEPRQLGRGAARHAARRDADAGAVRAERRDASRQQASASNSRSGCRAAARTARRAGCRSTPSSRSRTTSGCRTRIERADAGAVEASRKALEDVLQAAGEVRSATSTSSRRTRRDFAILFVPTEGLYAEAVSRPGLADALQRDYRVMLAGPMNLAGDAQQPAAGLPHARDRAALDRGLARAGRGARPSSASSARSSRGRKEKLDQVEQDARRRAARKSTTIARKLRDVEALPEAEADRLLTGEGVGPSASNDDVADAARRRRPAPLTRHARPMWSAISRWRQRRILRRAAIPDALWREATGAAPVSRDLRRRRARAPAREGRALPPRQGDRRRARPRGDAAAARVIAIEACVLVLELDLAFYDGFENVIVYPGEFVPDWEWEDEAGVVHRNDGPLAGEAMPGGPVVLSWPDVAAERRLGEHRDEPRHPRVRAQDRHAQRRSRRLPAAARRNVGRRLERDADGGVRRFLRAGRSATRTPTIDPYAAESPAEFFAVLSEVFFADPLLLQREYPRMYEQFAAFYRQDPGGPQLSDGGTCLRAVRAVELFGGRRILCRDRRAAGHDRRRSSTRKSTARPQEPMHMNEGDSTMIRKTALFVATLFAAGTAFAFHCPQDMKKIDDAMAKNPKLTAAQTDEVKKYRAEGETLHKAGKHQESVDTLAKAMKILDSSNLRGSSDRSRRGHPRRSFFDAASRCVRQGAPTVDLPQARESDARMTHRRAAAWMVGACFLWSTAGLVVRLLEHAQELGGRVLAQPLRRAVDGRDPGRHAARRSLGGGARAPAGPASSPARCSARCSPASCWR